MYALAVEFGVKGAPHEYLALGHHGEYFLTPHKAVLHLLPTVEHFEPFMKAIKENLKLGDLLDVDIWEDPRFETQFSDDPSDKSLDYTARLRDVISVSNELFIFKRDNEKCKLSFTVHEVKLKPHKTIPI